MGNISNHPDPYFFVLRAARSSKPQPIKRLYSPQNLAIDVIPRTFFPPLGAQHQQQRRHSNLFKRSDSSPSDLLLSSDALRLSLDLPRVRSSQSLSKRDQSVRENEFERVHIHLRPNEALFHPDAKINYLSSTGEVVRSERIDPSEHMVYHGEVLDEYWTDQRLVEDHVGGGGGMLYKRGSESARGVRGWASIHLVDRSGEGATGSMLSTDPIIFQGAINIDGQLWHVLTKENYEKVKDSLDPVASEQVGDMVFFLEEGQTSHGCSHDDLEFNTNHSHPVRQEYENARYRQSISPFAGMLDDLSEPGLWRRDDISSPSTGSNPNGRGNFINSIGQTQGCPTEQRAVYVGVAADCEYVSRYDGVNGTRTQIINNFNAVSSLYRNTFNISIGIIELNVQNETCPTMAQAASGSTPWNTPCDQSISLNTRLSLFSQWRGSQNQAAGLFHLMTACPTDSEVGVAWLGTLCQTTSQQQSGSWVSGTGVSSISTVEWSLTSHEIGHNFGAIHDCTSGCALTSNCCPLSTSTCNANGQYIMNPTTSTSEVAFSPCSVGNICSSQLNRAVDTTCLVAPGTQTTISLQQCGNGIVEEGEDCDPGLGGSSSCCDPTTCKFKNNAVCDPASSPCCTQSCMFANNGTVCRSSIDNTCDYTEYCTGDSSACPADNHAADGTSCGNDGLACASGQCTSLNKQCQQGGASLGISKACGQSNDRSCVVTCQSPNSTNQCVILNSPLIDGSPCGYGGHCYNSTCKAGSVNDTVGTWYRDNLQIAIPVTVVGSLIVLAILGAIIRCCCCGGRKRGAPKPVPLKRNQNRNRNRNAPPAQMGQRGQSTGGFPGDSSGPPPAFASSGPYPGPSGQYGVQSVPSAYYPGPPQPPPRHPSTFQDPHYQPSQNMQQGRPQWVDDTVYNGANFRR